MNTMKLLSVNVGAVQPIQNGKPSGKTGIFKTPRAVPVQVTPLGLEGDAIVDTRNHGGLDQAVYVFTAPDYAWWSAHLGRALEPGTFGENLTIADLESATLSIGDRLKVGDVVLEVTAPRIPCVTLAARMGDPQFVKKFRRAERPGVYCRVIQAGPVRAGDAVTLTPYAGDGFSVIAFFRLFYRKRPAVGDLRRLLAVPIPDKARPYYAEMLARLEQAPPQP
jgi:MOSC domain-containing protein YiiM